MSCRDVPWNPCEGALNAIPAVGYDPEPFVLAVVPQDLITQQVVDGLALFNYDVAQTHMWPDGYRVHPGYNAMTEFYIRGDDAPFFVTALDNGTTTGVLRQHAIRFNSSSRCDRIPYPDSLDVPSCSGDLPFEFNFNYSTKLVVSVCATGTYGVSPWSLSRDRQDIAEEFFIHVTRHIGNESTEFPLIAEHCKVNTTRGYFEIGNYHNDYAYGPLLETWPDANDMESSFNDALPEGEYKPGAEPDVAPANPWSGLPPSVL